MWMDSQSLFPAIVVIAQGSMNNMAMVVEREVMHGRWTWLELLLSARFANTESHSLDDNQQPCGRLATLNHFLHVKNNVLSLLEYILILLWMCLSCT